MKIAKLCLLLGVLTGSVQAALIDRGSGLIYDDVLDITWLQDASYSLTSGYSDTPFMSWEDSMEWTANLVYEDTARGITLDDWRLPTVFNNYREGRNGYFDESGTDSELSYMYFVNLGFEAWEDVANPWGAPNPSSELDNPFENMVYRGTWTDTRLSDDRGPWILHFHVGSSWVTSVNDLNIAWAVRDGDVATVPEPSQWLLMVTGLIFGFIYRLRLNSRKVSQQRITRGYPLAASGQ